MSREIGYLEFHCSTTEKAILKALNGFAYNPQESGKYHGNMHFHRDVVCKDKENAVQWIKNHTIEPYEDHAVFFMNGRRKFWLVKYEFHC